MCAHVMPRPWSLTRAVTQALLLGVIPLATASAQPAAGTVPIQLYGYVRVTHDKTKVECFAKKTATCMTAPKDTLLEVLYVEGDRYNRKDSNRYWVMLPADRWGRRVTGWIRGSQIEHVPLPPPSSTPTATLTEAPKEPADPRPTLRDVPASAPVETAPAARVANPDVFLNFEFGKSRLTDEARQKLNGAMVKPASTTQSLTIELEGHTDAIGSDRYNERLGLARAQSVKRYLMQQFGIPGDRISVVSYGERDPIAPNKIGRASCRERV